MIALVSTPEPKRKRSPKAVLPISELTKRVADDLVLLRAREDLSLADIARQVGISESTTGRIFRGVQSPTLDELQAISRVLGTTMTDVLSGDARRRI